MPAHGEDGGMLKRYGEYGGKKYPRADKVASVALQEEIDLLKARGRKPRSQINWSSRLGVRH